MKKLWALLGVIAYWLSLPLLHVYLRGTSRTRVLVTSGTDVLVVKPWLGNGKWILPGGGMHRNEPAKSAALRELREETGIRVTEAEYVRAYVYNEDRLLFNYELFTVKLEKKPELKRQLLEIVDIAWVPANKLSKHNANYDVVSALESSWQ